MCSASQTRVAALKIVGNNSIPEPDLSPLANSVSGQPFSEFNMASDRDAILNYYFDLGYPDVKIETLAQVVSPDLMNVTYTITEGERVAVDHVLMSGLQIILGSLLLNLAG